MNNHNLSYEKQMDMAETMKTTWEKGSTTDTDTDLYWSSLNGFLEQPAEQASDRAR